MDYYQALDKFFKSYNKDDKDPRLSLLITGGGFTVLDFLTKPGSSRIFEMAVMPYSQEMLAAFLSNSLEELVDPNTLQSCSQESVEKYVEGLHKGCSMNCSRARPFPNCIAVTAALTTNRYRKGENRAYIALKRSSEKDPIDDSARIFKIELSKFSEKDYETIADFPNLLENVRKEEDHKIAQTIFAIACNDPYMLPELNKGERILYLTPQKEIFGGDVQIMKNADGIIVVREGT